MYYVHDIIQTRVFEIRNTHLTLKYPADDFFQYFYSS